MRGRDQLVQGLAWHDRHRAGDLVAGRAGAVPSSLPRSPRISALEIDLIAWPRTLPAGAVLAPGSASTAVVVPYGGFGVSANAEPDESPEHASSS